MYKIFFYGLFLCSFVNGIAQPMELLRLEYAFFPGQNNQNSFQRIDTFADIPIKINDKGTYLIPRIAYRYFKFGGNEQTVFANQRSEVFQSFQAWLGYTFKMKNNWRFGTRLGAMLSSNFESDEISRNDLFYLAIVYFVKSKTGEGVAKPWKLILGASYPTIAGDLYPLPLAFFYQELNKKWSYTIGVPKTGIKYKLNTRLTAQTYGAIDGYFANIQNESGAPVAQSGSFDNISMRIISIGAGYDYRLTKIIYMYTNAGYTISNVLRFTNGNLNTTFDITDKNTFFVRGGLRIKI